MDDMTDWTDNHLLDAIAGAFDSVERHVIHIHVNGRRLVERSKIDEAIAYGRAAIAEYKRRREP